MQNAHIEVWMCESAIQKIQNFDENVNLNWSFDTDRKLNGFYIGLMPNAFVCVRACMRVYACECECECECLFDGEKEERSVNANRYIRLYWCL